MMTELLKMIMNQIILTKTIITINWQIRNNYKEININKQVNTQGCRIIENINSTVK